MTTARRHGKPNRARISSRGQITLPKAVTDRMGAKPGDELEFEQRRDGFFVRRRPRSNILEFAGLASGLGPSFPATAEAIDNMLEQARMEGALVRDQRLQSAEHAKAKGQER